MNDIKVTMGILCRMFSRRHNKPLSGVRRRIKLPEENESHDTEDVNEYDISEYESDFFTVDESHKMHERYILYSYNNSVCYFDIHYNITNI